MHKLVVLAMFKNESMIIKDWIEHYLREGVEHFYLIDNGSTDDYWEKIKIYENITLIKDPTRLPSRTQSILYNKIFLDKIKKEAEWLIVCDIDEYIYARNGYTKIYDVLITLSETIDKIWIPWKIFGSNGHVKHPDNVINSHTKKTNKIRLEMGYGKSIVRVKNLITIDIHTSNTKNNIFYTDNGKKWSDVKGDFLNELKLHLNHYMMMSKEYYLKVKCTRGGGQSGMVSKYTEDFFNKYDKSYNVVEDNELINKTY